MKIQTFVQDINDLSGAVSLAARRSGNDNEPILKLYFQTNVGIIKEIDPVKFHLLRDSDGNIELHIYEPPYDPF